MSSAVRSKTIGEIDINDLYALKAGSIWSALKKEHLSFWLLCLYFLFEYTRPQILYPVLDFLPWAQLSLILSIIFAFLDTESRWVGHALNKLMIIFAFIVVLSGVFAFQPAVSIGNWEVFGGWVIVYFLVVSIVNTEKRLFLFLFAYCLFNLKMSQHGALDWVSRGFSFASYGLIGAPGWFRNSGEYAIQMLIFGPLTIAIVMSLKHYWGRYKKWFMYAVASSGYLAIVGSSSRGAQLALLVIGVWWLLKLKGGFKALVAVLLVVTALFYLLPDEQMQRFSEMGEDETSQQRLTYWKIAVDEVIPNHPVIGVGYSNWYPYMWYKYPEGVGPLRKIEVSHNIYIQAASELGYVGLITFLILAIFAFITNSRTRKHALRRNNRFIYALTYALDAGLIGFMVAGSFVTVLYYPFFWIQLSMIAAINNVARNLSIKKTESATPEIKVCVH